MEWKPIETAPRGKTVLLWKPSTKEHYVAARIDGGHGPGWCTPDGFEIFGATHWMQLPDPPIDLIAAAEARRFALWEWEGAPSRPS
jgi:hypothetical protein